MSDENKAKDPVISAKANDEVVLESGIVADKVGRNGEAEMVADFEDLAPFSATPKGQAAGKVEFNEDDLSAALQDASRFDIDGYLQMLMILKEAERQNRLDAYFREMYEEAKQNKNSETILADFASPQRIDQVNAHFPDIRDQVDEAIRNRYLDADWASRLYAEAGYSNDEYESLPPSFHQTMAVTSVFEDQFPSENVTPLAERLKASKAVILDGLQNKNVQNGLQVAGWALSIATGGVALKLARMGVSKACESLSKNESFKSFVSGSLEKGAKALAAHGVPVENIASAMNTVKEKTRSVWGNRLVAIGAAAIGAVAVGLVLNEINFDKVLGSVAELSQNGNELLDAAGKTVGSLSDVANDFGAEAFRASAQVGTDAVNTATDLTEKAVDKAAEVADATINLGAQMADTAKGFGDEVVSAASQAAERVTGTISEGAHKIASLASDSMGNAKQNLVDGLKGAGEMLAGAADSISGVNSADLSDTMLTDEVYMGDPAHAEASAPAAEPAAYTVVPGDNLSNIAEQQLIAAGIEPTQANIDKTWRAIYEANKDVLGNNPDLIFPDQKISIDGSMLHGGPAIETAAPAPASAPALAEIKAPALDEFDVSPARQEEARRIIDEALRAAAAPAPNVAEASVDTNAFLKDLKGQLARRGGDSTFEP